MIGTRQCRVLIPYGQVANCYTVLHMEKPNAIRKKSYAFAVATVLFCKRKLIEERKEYILSKQLMRSGTSVGDNVEEAINAPSKRDFANKLSIALKEAYESRFWIFLVCDTEYVTKSDVEVLHNQVQEIIALLTAIIKTSRDSIA